MFFLQYCYNCTLLQEWSKGDVMVLPQMKEHALGLYEIAWCNYAITKPLLWNGKSVVTDVNQDKCQELSRQTHFMPYSLLIIIFSYANNLHGTDLNLMLVKW